MAGEFQVGEQTYRAQPMNAMMQFHVVRKFGPAMKQAQSEGAATMVECFARMSDDAADYVMAACLRSCQRKQGDGGWMVLWNEAAKRPQFSDINAPQMIEIAARVMEDTFASFSPAPLSA